MNANAAVLLEEYIFPNLSSIGYPPTPAYAERQARVLADLQSACRQIAGDILEKLGCTEKI